MHECDSGFISTEEAILVLRTRVWAWLLLAAMLAGGVFIIVDEFQNSQSPRMSAILIGVGVSIVPCICGMISYKHRVDVYTDHIVSQSIFGTHRVILDEVTRVDKSLDYMHIRHGYNKTLIVPSYLKHFHKLNKHLKKVCPSTNSN